jgi:methyl-accepting chemotaxis protein
MASLKETEQLTEQLEELVGQLRSELQNGEVDFEKLVTLSDQISERADGMAETFSSVNDALMQRIDQVKGGGSSGKQSSRSTSKAGSRS